MASDSANAVFLPGRCSDTCVSCPAPTHRDRAALTAAAAMSQRSGPARTSNSGRRSASHGRKGIVQSHRAARGSTMCARRARLSLDRVPPNQRIATSPAEARSATQNRYSGANTATLSTPVFDHETISIDAGTSQTAIPTPNAAMMIVPRLLIEPVSEARP